MSKLNFNWSNFQDMKKDLQDVSAGHVIFTDSQKFVMRKAVESFVMDAVLSVADKALSCDEEKVLVELELNPIDLCVNNQPPITFSVSKREKYEVDPSAIQAAGFKNQTEMFNSLAGNSDSLFDGLLKKTSIVSLDKNKAKRAYKTKGAGSELLRLSESLVLHTAIKKGGK